METQDQFFSSSNLNILSVDENIGTFLYRYADNTGTRILCKASIDPGNPTSQNIIKHEYHVLSSIVQKKHLSLSEDVSLIYQDDYAHIASVISLAPVQTDDRHVSASRPLFSTASLNDTFQDDQEESSSLSPLDNNQSNLSRNNLVLAIHDNGGFPLRTVFLPPTDNIASSQSINKLFNINLGTFLSISYQLSLALDIIHESNLLLRGLTPEDIFVTFHQGPELLGHLTEHFIQILDFSYAIYLEKGTTITGSYQNVRNVRYMSPEQTGRMNRMVDYRSDFYSLGTTLYELLIGTLPLDGYDTMDVIHALIARKPIPANIRNQNVPTCIALMLSKMLEKSAQNRYQSARGIRNDLLEIFRFIKKDLIRNNYSYAQHLSSEKEMKSLDLSIICALSDDEIIQILKPFKFSPGNNDPVFKTLLLSERLYGRTNEVQTVKEAFNFATKNEKITFLVLKGPPGCGKTRLLNELQPLSVEFRGLWMYAKFDLSNQGSPYHCLFAGTRKLFHDLRNSSETILQRIREYLRENLEPIGIHILKSVAPDLLLFYGPLPPIPPTWISALTPTQMRQLLFQAWQTIMRSFTIAGPLILILDDIQWADLSTVNLLIETIHKLSEMPILHVVTYRENEISEDHEIFTALQKAVDMGRQVFELHLKNLDRNNVSLMLSDTLHVTSKECEELTRFFMKTTDGNPFHIHAFLKELYYRNVLRLEINAETGHQSWTWSMPKVISANLGNSLLELMVSQLATHLPKETTNVLKYAACIGHTFDLQTLSKLVNESIFEVATKLLPALDQGYITTQGDQHRYLLQQHEKDSILTSGSTSTPIFDKFVHDRIQNAAYDLISAEEKPKIHLRIARAIYSKSSLKEISSKLFFLLHHYELGFKEVEEELKSGGESDYLVFADICYEASLVAKQSSAFAVAHKYIKMALNLVTFGKTDEEAWTLDYDRMLKIIQVQTYILCGMGRLDVAEKHFESILKHGKNVIDKLSASEAEYIGYFATFQYEKANQLIQRNFKLLGYKFENAVELKETLMSNIQFPSVSEVLSYLEKISMEPVSLIQISEMSVYLDNLFRLMVVAFVLANYEITVWASAVYMAKVMEANVFHTGIPEVLLYFSNSIQIFETDKRKRIFTLWEKLTSRYCAANPMLRTNSESLAIIICAATLSPSQIDEMLNSIISRSQDLGNVASLIFALFTHMNFQMSWSYPIPRILKWAYRYNDMFEKIVGPSSQIWNMTVHIMEEINCEVDDMTAAEIPHYKFEDHETLKSSVIIAYCRAIIAVAFEDYSALEELRILQLETPTSINARFSFFWTFPLLYSTDMQIEEKLKLLNDYIKLEESLYALIPESEAFRFFIMVAEKERLLSNEKEMLIKYDEAIEAAKKYDALFYEAFANERIGKYWIAKDEAYKKIAAIYFQEAIRLYSKLGFFRKCQQIEHSHHDSISLGKWPRKKRSSLLEVRASTTNSVDEISYDGDKSSQRHISVSDKPKRSASTRPSSGVSRAKSSEESANQLPSAAGHIDVTTLLKATQMIANESKLESILRALIQYSCVNAGATYGILALQNEKNELVLQAKYKAGKISTMQGIVLNNLSPDEVPILSLTVVKKTISACKPLIIEDAKSDLRLNQDLYTCKNLPKSILCVPIFQKNVVIGIVYLENDLASGAFTDDLTDIVISLAAAAAISIENSRLQQLNSELRDKLDHHATSRESSANSTIQRTPKFIVDGPIKNALDSIKEIMLRHPDLEKNLKKVEDVLISGQGAFVANIDSIHDESGRGIDADTKDWLKVTVQMDPSPLETEHERRGSTQRPRKMSVSTNLAHNNLERKELFRVLASYNSTSFNIFELEIISHGSPLSTLGPYLINEALGLSDKLNIRPDKVCNFFKSLESAYRSVPYHNSSHGADVMQTTLMLLTSQSENASVFSSLEIFAAILAGAMHDVDHPGLNNNFLIQTRNNLAILYSDQSILEYHHSATAFGIASANENDDIFDGLSPDRYRELRKIIVNMILATDMAKHFEYVNKFKTRISNKSQAIAAPSGFTTFFHPSSAPASPAINHLEDPLDRQLVLEIAIKCADLSNPTKSAPIAVRWTDAIMKEFFRQGDQEAENGLPISKFMDRHDPNVPKCQIGFIDVLVSPLFEAWRLGVGSTFYNVQCVDNISANRKFWDNLLKTQKLTPDDALLALEALNDPVSVKIDDHAENAYPQDNKKSKRFAV